MWADNRLPGWFTVACLALLVVVMAVRLLWVRRTPLDRQINIAVLWAVISSFLREPAVAGWLAPYVPGGAPLLFDLWHGAFLLATTGCVGMFLLRDLGPDGYRRPYLAWMGAACAVSVALIVLSHPARAQGLVIPDYGGWRYGAYFVLYSALPVSQCFYAGRPALGLWRYTTSMRDRAVWLVFMLIAGGGAINMTILAIGAVAEAAGVENAFTHESHMRVAGELILPFVALAFAALIPSSARAVAAAVRVDADSRAARRLLPMWRKVTAAAPNVVLKLTSSDLAGVTPAERLHRLRVETHDAVAIIGRFAEPLPDELEALAEDAAADDDVEDMLQVLEILIAANRFAGGGGPQPTDEPSSGHRVLPDLDTLARLWAPAHHLLATYTARQHAHPGTA